LMALLVSYILAPIASIWTKYMEWRIMRKGRILNPSERIIADKIGIKGINDIRVLDVPSITYPFHFVFTLIDKVSNRIFLYPAGMTMGNGIILDEKYTMNLPLIAHELVHVKQYQEYGGHFKFLQKYIYQCIKYGYDTCPLEMEANDIADQIQETTIV